VEGAFRKSLEASTNFARHSAEIAAPRFLFESMGSIIIMGLRNFSIALWSGDSIEIM
jgi:hypothetical protein